MMKILKIFIILLLFISCSDKKPKNKLTEFDEILGIENSETLSYLVADFENDFLKKQYPNLDTDSAYKKFLSEISQGKTKHLIGISEKSLKIFKNSQLRFEIYCVPDSSWVETNSWNDKTMLVKARTKCINPDGTFENGSMEMPFNEKEISKDSIVKRYMTFVKANFNGKYQKALNSISDKSDFLNYFAETRRDFGLLSSEMVAKMMLDFDVDVNDYYINRIIVAELGY